MTALLCWQQLGYQDRDGKTLLKPVSGHIDAGARIALQGASGSGKTVFLRALARLNHYHCQQMRLHGRCHHDVSILQWRQSVALVMQNAAMTAGSVLDNLQLPFAFKRHQARPPATEKIRKQLRLFGKEADFLHRNTAQLSGGERQIVNLLRSLQLDPAILLLDEPTAALDREKRQIMQQLLIDWVAQKTPQRAFLWVGHDSEELAIIANHHWQMRADGQLLINNPAPAHA